ncbi:MAG TPA: hypothetical protein DIT07_04230 [Sphingobacteriaceae bacterium]|nr:hypothetical protein [Sphingobacteriaceae bacterium]
MEYLKFNFCHPVKGHASLIQIPNDLIKFQTLNINSDVENIVKVPITKCQAGKWKVILEWQYDNQSFTHQKEFEIKKVDS